MSPEYSLYVLDTSLPLDNYFGNIFFKLRIFLSPFLTFAQAGLMFAMQTKLAWNSQPSTSLGLASAGVTGIRIYYGIDKVNESVPSFLLFKI